MAYLSVKNIFKTFGKTTVLNGVSFEVHKGEFVVLLGPSGCGKTTILRIIAGLEHQDSGEIYLEGREVSSLEPRKRDVAMVFQSYALYPHMTVYENMAFPLKMQKTQKHEIDRKVRETARLLGIEALLDRKPAELSGGQRQRVAIGRAIVRKPKLFLFDEPLSNLDAQLRASMRVELRQLHERLQTTSIYVTHDQVEAMTLADRIILLKDGILQQVGTPEEIYQRPTNLFVATFVGSPQINLINGHLERVDNHWVFVAGPFRLSVDIKNVCSTTDIVMGIRPEAVVVGEGPFSARVTHIEPLGAEKIVHLDFYGHRIQAKAPSDFMAKVSDTVPLKLLSSGVHLFCQGKRVE